MGNVFRILLRDIKRLLKAPAALVVVAALLVLPSLYTWYNVLAFWDPYGSTDGFRVCVVNQDAGASTDITGEIDVGDIIAEKVAENDQVDWAIEDYDTAMEELKAGEAFAVYVIPQDFSACLVSPLTGEVKSPNIQYYVNEKLGPVSPKISDQVASSIEELINSAFVSTVTEAATEAVDEAMGKVEADISAVEGKVAGKADDAKAKVAEVRKALSGVQDTIGEARSKVAGANDALAGASTLNDDTQTVLKDVVDEADALQKTLSNMSSKSIPNLSAVTAELSQMIEKAGAIADSVASAAETAGADVGIVSAKIQPAIAVVNDAVSDLEKAAAAISDEKLSGRLSRAASDLSSKVDEVQAVLDGAATIADEVESASQTAVEVTESLGESITLASDSLTQYSNDLYGSAASTVSSSVAQIGSVCSRLSSAASNLDAAVGQVRPLLDQLDGVLADCGTSTSQTNALIGGIQDDLDTVVADARLLSQSGIISNLLENGTLNSKNISEFMGSPTKLETTEFYTINAYGSKMAPLFMNLTFWIGAFMLMIIFLLEVDSEGFEELKPWQRYLGRFLLFALLAAPQAVICCAGTLALGVQAAVVPALFGAAVVASLAFLSIIYALSSTFGHVGKALCIVLVFAQIPGGSGLYPIELTSGFYQAIYPFLPFTYGIDAMREAIGGFYGDRYVHDMAALAAFIFGSLGLGLLLGPLMSNVVRMTARQVREGDLYNGEDAVTPERPYRLAHVLRALTDKDSYREDLEARYARFSRRYPIFIRASIVLGVGVPVVVGVLLALNAAEKATLLTFFLVWLVALVGFLVVVESLRYSFERQLDLERMSDARLLRIFSNRDRMVRANARLTSRRDREGDDETDKPAKWGLGRHAKHGAAGVHAKRKAGGVRNVWLIARRDYSGLFKNVMSVIITVGLVILPSLFAWYNILACWNVFDNTGYLSVAVASEDEGFESDLLTVNVNIGEKVVSALRENDQINWVFTTADDAIEGTKSGKYYAALVIPEGFSKSMLTFYEGDSASAAINYYVNEKKNAIAPNLTEVGADTVSYSVNATFAKVLSEVAIGVAQSLSNIVEEGDVDGRIATLTEHMRSIADGLDQSASVLGSYSSLGKDSQGLVSSSAEVVESARERLQAAASDIDAGKKRLRNQISGLSDSVKNVSDSLSRVESVVEDLAQRADEKIADTVSKLPDAVSLLRAESGDIDDKVAKLSEAQATLEKLRDALKSGTSAQIDIDVSNGDATVNVDSGGETVYTDVVKLDESINALSNAIEALEDVKSTLSGLSDDSSGASSVIEDKLAEIDARLNKIAEKRDKLEELRNERSTLDIDIDASLSSEAEVMIENTVVLDKDIAALGKVISFLQEASAACTEAADSLEAGKAEVEKRAGALRKLAKKAKDDVAAVKEDLTKGLKPGADKLKSDIGVLIRDLEHGADELRALDPDLAGTLEAVAAALGDVSTKIDGAGVKLHAAAQKVRDLANAVDAAMKSGDLEKLRSLLQTNAGDLAAALTEPVQVERMALFPVENFGSAMAPLYCTLALFVGALLIMVTMKPEVSRKGRELLYDPKPRHLFFGRFMTVATVSLMQTTLLALGNMLFLKVQVASPALYLLSFWISGLVFAFILYTLVVSFGNLGKAIGVLLLIVQVTACNGSYPIQILPDFVQMLSPWMPATYVVKAINAAMLGMYQNDFWVAMGHLLLFVVPFLLLGLVLRKPMERFMKFYVRKVEECGIMA